ncbi:MAG: helix-turn-helix domain-containing protein [archaeon]
MDDFLVKIAGEIALSNNPGACMKKWREIFGINQIELAKYLNISPSTISDYEGNRRKSPGISVIKRFVNALIQIDMQRGGWVVKKFAGEKISDIFIALEFSKPCTISSFCSTIRADLLTLKEESANRLLYGFTLVDSIKAILDLPADDFIKIYGSTTERALLFTNVTLGRSPMIAIRITKLKPALVIFHNISNVDKLAIKIAETLRIPLGVTFLPIEEIQKRIKEEYL